MKLRILPSASVKLPLNKSEEEAMALLRQVVSHRNGSETNFESYSHYFRIKRTLQNKGSTSITANGAIVNEGENRFVRLDIVASDGSMVIFAILWYAVNVFVLVFLIYISITDRVFRFSVLLPPIFMFFGYGITTATIQGAIDELIGEVKRAFR